MCMDSDSPALGPGSGLGEAMDVTPPELTQMLFVAEVGRGSAGPIPALGK